MNNIRIFFVSPYEGMKEAINDIAQNTLNIEYEVFIGNLSNLDDITDRIDNYKPDIVISRGLTADEISQRVSCPVVKIKLQAYDILSAIRQAQGYNRPFAVIGYDDMTSGAELICGLLNYNTQIVTVKSESGFKDAISELKQKGYDLIVGGTLASGLAEKIGLTGITIVSGEKSIEDAIKESINIFNAYKNKTLEAKLLRQLNSLNPTKSYLFDRQHELVYGDAADGSLCSYLEEKCGKFGNEQSLNAVTVIEDTQYIIRGRRIISDKEYFAFYIDSRKAAGDGDAAAVKILGSEDVSYSLPDITYESSRYMGKLIGEARSALASGRRVMIDGDEGTEKDELAAFVFRQSRYSDGFFVSIDMSLASAENIDSLFKKHANILKNSIGVIYLKNAEAASKSLSGDIIAYLDKYDPVCIVSVNRNRLQGASPLIDYLRDSTVLAIPPLKDRKDDINIFARMYIAELNLRTAQKNIGLDENAADFIEAYTWPENLRQLRRVIAKAVRESDKYYLSADDLKKAVNEDEVFLHKSSEKIDLSGSLKEITKEVITAVLEEEKGSKVRTAERLKISRSKLWSILKESSES